MNENSENNFIFIGSKPLGNYLKSITIQFEQKNQKEVVIRARGKFITKAVDIVEISKKNYPKIKVKEIKIGSEKLQNKENKQSNISIIKIILSKE